MLNDDQTPEEAAQRAAQIRNARYGVHITVSDDPDAKTFRSTSVIRFDSNGPGTWIDLDADNVRAATINGRPVDLSTYARGRLEISGLQPTDNRLEIVADCRYSDAGIGLHRFVDTDSKIYMYTNCEPFEAHRWFACFDQQSIKGRLTLTFTTPSDWKQIANYDPDPNVPVIDDGRTKTITYQETRPIPTYLMAGATGPFAEFHKVTASGIPMGLYVRQSLVRYFDRDFWFDMTEKGLAWYQSGEVFDRPGPFPKYDQVLVPEFNSGAMENPGCITFRDQVCIFRGKKPTETQRGIWTGFGLHEMGHEEGFGDLVSPRGWHDLWLNESQADLFEKLAEDDIYPQNQIWSQFAIARKSWGMADDQLPSSAPVAGAPGPVSRSRDDFNGLKYAKGGSALYQLMHYIGRPTFFKGIRSYFDRYGNSGDGCADLAQYLGEMEKASGRNLGDWARRWLRTTGMNKLVAATTTDRDPRRLSRPARYTKFSVVQQPGAGDDILRPHVVRVGLYNRDARGKLVRTTGAQVTMATDQRTTDVPSLVGKKVPDLVMVNDDDLTYAKVRLDDASLQTLRTELRALEDPLARANGWAILWDMTRDGELPARDFVDCIIEHLPSETHDTFLLGGRGLIAKASQAINDYADPGSRSGLRARMADCAKQAMENAAPESDIQKAWAQTYISNCDAPADLHFIRTLLDGRAAVPGLELDPDLRWRIVWALASKDDTVCGTRLISAADITAEATRDGTDEGQRRAITARALRPTAEAKAVAWQAITQEPELSLYERSAWVDGFFRTGQEELTRPYVQRYADFVPTLWESDVSREVAKELTERLYPRPLIEQATLDVMESVLTQQLPPSALKILRDEKDNTRRAMVARRASQVGRSQNGHGGATVPQGRPTPPPVGIE